MARKVFVSYKYSDTRVAPLDRGIMNLFPTTARHYVDKIIDALEDTEIYKGEEDGNNLSDFKDETIRTQLKKRIRDSSITVVLISRGMKEPGVSEQDQWIPWEVQYSLLRKAYGETRSSSNGMLAVALPDENGSYGYYLDECDHCSIRTHKTGDLFQILGNNMFNLNEPDQRDSTCFAQHGKVHAGNNHSYIHQVKWSDFNSAVTYYLDIAEAIRENIDSYKLQKRVLAT